MKKERLKIKAINSRKNSDRKAVKKGKEIKETKDGITTGST